MSHNSQLDRYKKLLSYIEEHLTEDIDIGKIEEACHYSYRNINRIFEALHQETIGKYIKRLRLEKAAQYLKYSEFGISQIAYEVGFEDRSAFSKAFKKKYSLSPREFRESAESVRAEMQKSFEPKHNADRPRLKFEIEILPDFYYLFVEYRGDYKDVTAIEEKWQALFTYASERRLLTSRSAFMTEIIDDAEISDHIHSRYNQALILEKKPEFKPTEHFRIRPHKRQKYAKFIHQGSHESAAEFYSQIYTFWMIDVELELADLPILEFYPNFDEHLPENELITEIFIPLA